MLSVRRTVLTEEPTPGTPVEVSLSVTADEVRSQLAINDQVFGDVAGLSLGSVEAEPDPAFRFSTVEDRLVLVALGGVRTATVRYGVEPTPGADGIRFDHPGADVRSGDDSADFGVQRVSFSVGHPRPGITAPPAAELFQGKPVEIRLYPIQVNQWTEDGRLVNEGTPIWVAAGQYDYTFGLGKEGYGFRIEGSYSFPLDDVEVVYDGDDYVVRVYMRGR
jgi:hypothetical protein